MNLLIIEPNETAEEIINLAKKSKFLDKIYTATNSYIDEIPNIEYSDIQDLIKKAKALHIDVAITFDKSLILQGIAEEFKNHGLTVFCPNRKWLNLEISRIAAKKLAQYYSINIPQIFTTPLCFPIIAKTEFPEHTVKLHSMNEVIEAKKYLSDKKIFFEEYLEGETFNILSIWDGKNILTFDKDITLTEVQQDRLDLFKTKLNFLLSDENADFQGFFITKLIWAKNDWYLLDFVMCPNKKSVFNSIKTDFLYILNSAVYQKLNEI